MVVTTTFIDFYIYGRRVVKRTFGRLEIIINKIMNLNNSVKSLTDILNNLNLISLPTSLWGVHIHPKYEYIAILHVVYGTNLQMDKGILIQYDDLNDKIKGSIFLCCKNVSIPEINTTINCINDISQLVFSIHELKICDNWQYQQNTDKTSNSDCLIYVSSGFNTCLMCNTPDKAKFMEYLQHESNSNLNKSQLDAAETIWQDSCANDLNDNLSDNLIPSSEDVDVVVKEILELEYTNTNPPIPINIEDNSTVFTTAETSLFSSRNCDKTFSELGTMIKQEKNNFKRLDSKNSDKIFSCVICKKSFSNQSHLKVHHRIHSGERPYPCEYCNKRFFTNSHLKEHIRLHTGLKPYKCVICGKMNSHQSAHQRHVLTHSDVKPNLCNICGKTFCKGYRMEDHLATHSSERPFNCPQCEKNFSKQSSLRMHLKSHSEMRAFVCTICGKNYSTKSNLGTHMKSHTGVKPHACGACPARFVHPRLLRIHQRTHSGEKPYACSDCGRAFAKKVHLTVHKRVHSGERPYFCEVEGCEKTFTTSGNLNAHKKVHHSGIVVTSLEASKDLLPNT